MLGLNGTDPINEAEGSEGSREEFSLQLTGMHS